MAIAVIARGEVRFGDRHADGVGETLTERAGGDFDARRMFALRVAGRLAAPLPKKLDVVEGEVVTGDVQQAIKQSRAVAGGEDEAVAVGPRRVGRVVLEVARP